MLFYLWGVSQEEEEKKKLQDRIDDALKEIERLNNIINELEKYLNERSEYTNFGVILDKIKELKGSEKE